MHVEFHRAQFGWRQVLKGGGVLCLRDSGVSSDSWMSLLVEV